MCDFVQFKHIRLTVTFLAIAVINSLEVFCREAYGVLRDIPVTILYWNTQLSLGVLFVVNELANEASKPIVCNLHENHCHSCCKEQNDKEYPERYLHFLRVCLNLRIYRILSSTSHQFLPDCEILHVGQSLGIVRVMEAKYFVFSKVLDGQYKC